MKTKQKTLEEVFGEIKQSPWNKAAAEWKANIHWIKYSQKIALEVLEALDSKEMSQKELADKMNVSPQIINKWLKGKDNFTLETISKFENALDIKLIHIITNTSHASDFSIERIPPFMGEYLRPKNEKKPQRNKESRMKSVVHKSMALQAYPQMK